MHLQHLGHEVCFVSAVGKDQRGDDALQVMRELSLASKFVTQTKIHPTGVVNITLGAHTDPCFTIHRPAAYDCPFLSEEEIEALKQLAELGNNWPTLIDLIIDNIKNFFK